MRDKLPESAIAWMLAIAGGAIFGTLATACMMPFVAVASLAAATMPRSSAAITVVGIWAVNQLLGFALLDFPFTGYALSWGVALGVAALAAMMIARATLGTRQVTPSRLVLAFAIAFAGYEALLFGFASVAGGTETFAPRIVLRLLANESAWLAGLAVLNILLTRVSPRLFGRGLALRPA